ncbi:MAG TPA: Lrp/AsnC ligand binding domain-containing protein, partial [Acidimicrobiales bacterium]
RAGFGVTALILLNVRQADWQAARDLLLAVPGVVYLAMTSGAFDMVMLVRAADVHHLRDVVLGELHDVPQVRSTQTVFVLEEHGPLPLPRRRER